MTRSALENAASVSAMVLTTESLVADLPEKIEDTVMAQLTGEQRKLYLANQDRIAQQVQHRESSEFKKDKLKVLAELTKLRQICCDPRLHYEGEVTVFLISLKAGGVGLNLTAADVVIHYDPWWNVAAQDQATDRAHRIGQQHTVTVYKLIAKDTIEERIMQMQESKRDLVNSVLGGDGR